MGLEAGAAERAVASLDALAVATTEVLGLVAEREVLGSLFVLLARGASARNDRVGEALARPALEVDDDTTVAGRARGIPVTFATGRDARATHVVDADETSGTRHVRHVVSTKRRLSFAVQPGSLALPGKRCSIRAH